MKSYKINRSSLSYLKPIIEAFALTLNLKNSTVEVNEECFITYKDLQNYIFSAPANTEYQKDGSPKLLHRYNVASLLYDMYATGMLTVTDLGGGKYSKYRYWKGQQLDARNIPGSAWKVYQLDHKLPRYYYPELTFDVSNWELALAEDNYAKGAVVDADLLKKKSTARLKALKADIANW